MERSLNPTYSLGPTFETVTRGLDDGATLTGLWLQGNRLWASDTTNARLMTFDDTLTVPLSLTAPADKSPGVGIITGEGEVVKNVELDWETLNGATEYEWQLDDDTDFSAVLFEGDSQASAELPPDLEPATTYYWRVRASEPVLSPWSEKWSFTTTMGAKATGPELISPEAGATGVSLRPVFQWSALAGAKGYELIVSTEAALDNPTVLKTGDYALTDTAWECGINLDCETTYYWKVRAVSATTHSDWSAVGAFTTQAANPNVAETPPPSDDNPATAAQVTPAPTEPPPATMTTDTPDWVKYLIGALLSAVVVLVLLRNMRRPNP